ncbi:MAG: hypothetical protein KDA75_17470 [Planctomycetaceae bacterium]|nr:hypothetical protein [Planctomycetaceae bacterium]
MNPLATESLSVAPLDVIDCSPADRNSRRVVIKVGGSLLDLPDLRERLAAVLSDYAQADVALLCGGGGLANEVRRWCGWQTLTESTAHALAMQTLDVTASLVAQLLPDAELCDAAASVRDAWRCRKLAVIAPNRWFNQSSGWFDGRARLATGPLPQSWNVTSDTLAGCAAIDLEADELLLLKSTELPEPFDIRRATGGGLVDRCFERVADHIPDIRWLNLRSASNNMQRLCCESRSTQTQSSGVALGT